MPLACFKRDTYCARALNSNRFSGKILGGLKQKHKKQPFSDASASHLALVMWCG